MMKISVIIPCYNVSAYIDRCLQSVTEQTIGVEELEIICVDDCSTDDTVAKLLSWEERFPENLMVVRSAKNGRQGAARNIGLSYAGSEWIAFLDADDWLEPDALEKLFSHARESTYDMVLGESIRDNAGKLSCLPAEEKRTGKPDRELRIRETKDRKEMIRNNSLRYVCWGRLIRKSFLTENNIFFPEGLAYEDIYWGILVNFYVKKVCFIEEKLHHYFVNPGSTVLNEADYHTDMLTVNSLIWMELRRRGLWEEYRDEIEVELVYSGLLAFLKVIALRFQTPPYSLFRLLQAFAREHLPEPQRNPYYGGLPEFHRLMLDALYMDMKKEEFRSFIADVKKIGL